MAGKAGKKRSKVSFMQFVKEGTNGTSPKGWPGHSSSMTASKTSTLEELKKRGFGLEGTYAMSKLSPRSCK